MITSNNNVIDYIAKWPVIMITLLLHYEYILKLTVKYPELCSVNNRTKLIYLKLIIYSSIAGRFKECIVAEKQVIFHCTIDQRKKLSTILFFIKMQKENSFLYP